MKYLKMQDKVSEHENAGPENAAYRYRCRT